MEDSQNSKSAMDEVLETQDVHNSTRPVARHSWSSTHLLKQWYTSNSAWPYPTAEEKVELSHRTGLSVRQISQWFVNTRRRNIDGRPSEILDNNENPISLSLPVTLDSPQEEGANVKSVDCGHNPSTEGNSASSRALSQIVVQDTSIEFDSQDDAPMNAASNPLNAVASAASSYSSSCSHDSDLKARRHRKKQHSGSRHTATDVQAEDKALRIYQCTFCTDTFKLRYDWTRHEGTLHLALEQWTCLPAGPKRWNVGDATPKCSLCDACDPTDAHLRSHRISDCIMKPATLRSFHRKDHLNQHLRLAHGIDRMIPSMNSWKSKISEVKSRCGFCGETFSLWPDRNDHLVDHFRRGKSMKDWRGDRGLEPSVAMLVQSAMPPYLIGTESVDLEPFSASKGAVKKTLSSPEIQNPPNVFEVLTARLGDFVTSARANGATINCDILRQEARLILYGDDDPLNQTPADNDQWLTLFKIGHGLTSEPSQPSVPLSADDASTPAPNSRIATSILPDTGNPAFPHEVARLNPGSNSTASQISDGVESKLPWWCQSPECLAELMQMSQEFSLTSVGDIKIDGESTRDL